MTVTKSDNFGYKNLGDHESLVDDTLKVKYNESWIQNSISNIG